MVVMEIVDILLILLLILILVYLYLDMKYSYWTKKCVPHLPATSIIFGNVKELIMGKDVSATFYDKAYRQFPDKQYCGVFEFQNPVLILRDPQIIQTVLVEKFNSFHDNKFCMSEKNDVLFGKNPFVLHGSRWKESRSIFVSSMASSKIKVIEDIVRVVYKDMSKFIDCVNIKDGVEAFDLASRFTSETVANFAWGIRSNGFSSESAVKEGFDQIQYLTRLTSAIILFNPFVAYWLKLRMFPNTLEEFLLNITGQVVNNVEKNNSNQSSLVRHLLSARERLTTKGKDITLNDITGYVGTLYIDGYDTAGRVLSYILYTLMQYPDVQQRLREEIMNVEQDFTIENVNKVEYLDMVVSEVLRLYPQVPYLGRRCTEASTLGSLNVEAGTELIIPVFSLHHDPMYFPNPTTFNPENFSEENKKNRHKFTYLPFGQGPRICAGMKFALAKMKLILCYILKDYELIIPTNHDVKPIEPDLSGTFVIVSDHPLNVAFKKIE